MPMFEVLDFFEKKGDKSAVNFERIMQFSCSSRFRIPKTLYTHSVLWKKTKNSYHLAVIGT